MNSLFDYIVADQYNRSTPFEVVDEGIFDTGSSDIDVSLVKDWLDKHVKCTGNYTFSKKDNSITATGYVSIMRYDGEEFPDYVVFKKVKGSMNISLCPEIHNVGNLFGGEGNKCNITQGLFITECPKLDSLAGLPTNSYNFRITYCKSLKSLDGLNVKAKSDVVLMKNGKKFAKEDVLKHIINGKPDQVMVDVNESVDEEIRVDDR